MHGRAGPRLREEFYVERSGPRVGPHLRPAHARSRIGARGRWWTARAPAGRLRQRSWSRRRWRACGEQRVQGACREVEYLETANEARARLRCSSVWHEACCRSHTSTPAGSSRQRGDGHCDDARGRAPSDAHASESIALPASALMLPCANACSRASRSNGPLANSRSELWLSPWPSLASVDAARRERRGERAPRRHPSRRRS